MPYKIVSADHTDTDPKYVNNEILRLILEEKVNALMNDGWSCSGNNEFLGSYKIIIFLSWTPTIQLRFFHISHLLGLYIQKVK
jgi:hypothetical protein